MPFDDLCGQGSDRSSARSERLHHLMALTLFGERLLDRRELSPNSPNPVQQAALVTHRVSHDARIYPGGYMARIKCCLSLNHATRMPGGAPGATLHASQPTRAMKSEKSNAWWNEARRGRNTEPERETTNAVPFQTPPLPGAATEPAVFWFQRFP